MYSLINSSISAMTWSMILLMGILIIIYNWKRRHLYYCSFKIPGPLAIPIIGNIQFIVLGKKNLLQLIMNIITSYPSVSRQWLGPNLYISTSRPQDVEIVLNDFLEKAHFYKYFPYAIQNTLITTPVNIWKKHRKIFNLTFSSKIINSYYEVFLKHSRKFVTSLENECGKAHTDIMNKLWQCTTAIAFEALYDTDSDKFHMHNLIGWVERLEQIAVERFFSPYLYFGPIWKLSRLYKEDRTLGVKGAEIFQKLIDEKRQKQSEMKEKENLFNHVLNTKQMNGIMSDKEIIDESIFMVPAAGETVASLLTSFILSMGLYPEIQERLYQEIISVIPDPEKIDLEQMKTLDYLERVIKETMRLLPPVPLIARFLDKNIYCDPYVFPAGCNVVIPILLIHRNPELWPDPLKFDPDRFLPENCEKRHRSAYIPFSCGSRNCIGLQYAMLLAKCMGACIIRKFKIKTLEPMSVEDLQYDFVLVTKLRGYKILLEKRET